MGNAKPVTIPPIMVRLNIFQLVGMAETFRHKNATVPAMNETIPASSSRNASEAVFGMVLGRGSAEAMARGALYFAAVKPSPVP